MDRGRQSEHRLLEVLCAGERGQVAIQRVFEFFDLVRRLNNPFHRFGLLDDRSLHGGKTLHVLELPLRDLLPLPAALLGDRFLVGGEALGMILRLSSKARVNVSAGSVGHAGPDAQPRPRSMPATMRLPSR